MWEKTEAFILGYGLTLLAVILVIGMFQYPSCQKADADAFQKRHYYNCPMPEVK